MTEKRFSLIKDIGTDECCDNLYDNGTYIGAISGGSEMICYLLNDLSNENEQLKQQLKSIENSFEFSCTENYIEFDKDELNIRDTHTELMLKDGKLCISIFIPQINDYFKFFYLVTGRRFEREFIKYGGDVE